MRGFGGGASMTDELHKGWADTERKPSYEDLQARIKELEAQLEAIGAGGVSGRPITKIKQTNFARTAAWLAACGKEPSPANASLQIGCHLEEIAEFLVLLAFEKKEHWNFAQRAAADLTVVGRALKTKTGEVRITDMDREAALDALCDSEVTGNGVAFLLGFNKPAADLAVLSANESKLVDGKPVILPGGKIGKPEGWVAPDLSAFV